jgi:hypothetical protein
MATREERAGHNEVFFREVNERLIGLNEKLGVKVDRIDFLCECAQASCQETLRLSLAEYELVRTDGAQFLIVDGHDLPEIEEVVQRNGHYIVVRKLPGVLENLARDSDPRA